MSDLIRVYVNGKLLQHNQEDATLPESGLEYTTVALSDGRRDVRSSHRAELVFTINTTPAVLQENKDEWLNPNGGANPVLTLVVEDPTTGATVRWNGAIIRNHDYNSITFGNRNQSIALEFLKVGY